MPSHAAIGVLAQRPRQDGTLEVELKLACGCTLSRTLPVDRLLAREDGAPYVVGKYPCPRGHAVRPPADR